MVRIPSEYQEVEYIESTGKQYIDTGYIPVLSPILRMKIRVTDKQDRDIAGFVSNVYPSFIIDSAPAQSRWYNRYGNTAAYGVNPGPVIGQIQEWEWGKEVKFNENLVRTNAECDWSSNTQKMNIFSGRNKAFVAIYSCSLYDEDLVRNFIPCYRKSDGEIGMYDTVSKTFFTNQGTGTFLKGNDVSYDTVNLMESRRRILLNTPHLESLSGSTLSLKTDMASKLKECKVHFTPIQEGTGDPSPDNVRPIHGWNGVTVNHNNNSITIPFPQTIYGGYVDLVKGEVVEEWKCYDMGDLDWGADTTEHLFAYTFEVMPVNENNALMTTYCEGYYPTHNSSLGTIRRIIGNYAFMGRSSYKSLYFRDDSYTTGAEFKQGNAGNHIIVPLATPTTYPLDPVTIRTLRGQNNIWSDANGNIDIKYWTH